jgi:hypothetical protein
MKKTCKICSYFNKSILKNQLLKVVQIGYEMKYYQLLKDAKTKWNFTFTMIERILANKQLIFNIFLMITHDTLNPITKKEILKQK